MVTGSLVNTTADRICNASFLAPCGTMLPFNCLPPITSKPVTISVYSRITNPRFAGYTDYSPITDEFVAQSSEQVELSKNENVTGKQVQYGIIPIADTISRTVEKVAGDIAGDGYRL